MNGADPAEEAIFNVARLFRDSEKLGAYLDLACDGKPELRERIEGLLGAAPAADEFFKRHTAPFGHVIAPLAAGATVGNSISEGPGTIIGRYKLLEKIGEGGCGVVYMAEQEEPVRRRVALKIIKLGMDTRNVIARFEAERQALALMDHPNIAKVFDAGATESPQPQPLSHPMGEGGPRLGEGLSAGRPYFAMELVRGVKITDYCNEKNLSTRERLGLFSQVCNAIQHAHQKGIIHRDIKPSNVLVTVNDGVAVPKVIDFGIAKATTDQRLTDKTVFTAFEQFIGTPAYMSPEQAELTSVDVDTRSDIYSLGVLLYELLTGKTPFDATELLKAGLDEMRRTLREREPERPSTRVSTLGGEELTTTAKRRGIEAPKLANLLRGDLDWIVMKCLEKDRARRYETANGLASDIQRHLNNEPVIACPPSNFYRFRKLVRRNKLAFTAVSAVAAALLIGLGVSTWMFLQERKAEREQASLRQQAQAEATKSQQVAAFLKKMLQGVGPSVALGRDTTLLREILDQTVKNIGKDLTSQPEVQVDLCLTLAATYHDLGLYQQMEGVARQSLQIARSGLGEENESVAASLVALGDALQHLGEAQPDKLQEAEEYSREGLEMTRKALGNENLKVASALEHLANILSGQGRMAESERLQREALAMFRKLIGNECPEAAKSLSDLALILGAQYNKLAEAETANREALAMQRKLLGGDHPDVAKSLRNLANVLFSQGKYAEAETKYREALAMWRKLQAYERPEAARVLLGLASALVMDGKPAEAENRLREALAVRRRLYGEEHAEVADSLNRLADLLHGQNRLAEAETLCRQALSMRRKLFGKDHSEIAESLRSLANVLHADGRLPEAEMTFRELLAMQRRLFGDVNDGVAWSLHWLGVVLQQQGKLSEAEVPFREVVLICKKLSGNEAGEVAGALTSLANLLREQDKLAEAEGTYREALAIARKLPENDRLVGTEPLEGLATLLAKQGKLEEAEALLREALSTQRKLLGNAHPWTIPLVKELKALLEREGKQAEAKALADELSAAATEKKSEPR